MEYKLMETSKKTDHLEDMQYRYIMIQELSN